MGVSSEEEVLVQLMCIIVLMAQCLAGPLVQVFINLQSPFNSRHDFPCAALTAAADCCCMRPCRDARVSLTKDPDQGLLVTLVSEAQRKQHVADAAQHRGGTGHQLMLSLNMDDWEAMCTVATATHMPHRDPAPH